MNCPGCRTKLDTDTYHGVEVNPCGLCKGVWLDHKEIDEVFGVQELPEKLLLVAGEKPVVSVPEGSRTCPRCTEFLTLVEVDGIRIEVCSHCHGLFLDSGELEQLARAAEARFQAEF